MLLVPPLATALLSLLAGMMAATPVSPLSWAQLIVQGEFSP